MARARYQVGGSSSISRTVASATSRASPYHCVFSPCSRWYASRSPTRQRSSVFSAGPARTGHPVADSPQQVHGAGHVAARRRGQRGLQAELAARHARDPFRCLHPHPQFQGQVIVAVRLGGGADALGLGGGPDRGGERAGDVVARHAVVREFGGGAGYAGEQAREPGVQPGPLPRHQVAVYGLAQERVPEPVPVGPVGCQQLMAGRLADRRLVSVVGQAGGGPDQVVGGATAGDGRRPQHLLRRVRYAFHARQQQLGQPGRQRALRGVRARRRGQELLGVVGVSFRALHQGVEGGGGQGQRGVRRVGQDFGQGGGGERPEFDQRDHGQPEQLRDHAAQRVAAVQVVGAVRPDDRDALAVQHAGEERDQVTRGGVGPVQVLDDQQDRAAGG